ncbi:MAG: hemerythrin domain-containing protein [Trichlorobacter sp.]|nr:hemerythrin domain-containing protein [Trichlorobacter sp.]
MKTLISELKQEHNSLREQVALIKKQGIVSAEGFNSLQHLRELLQAHILREEIDLYPQLELAAKNDDDLRIMLDRFQGEMQEITSTADQFFQRYNSRTQSLDFARDVARLFSILTNRMVTEETVLYPRMEQLV